MSESIYFITIALFLGTLLAIFAMKYLTNAYQAHARIKDDSAYKALAEKAAAAQSESATALADIQARLASVENILKAVG